MKLRWLTPILLVSCLVPALSFAAGSTISEVDGKACMGYDKSRRQTEDEALDDARKKALERAAVYISSESTYEDMLLKKDISSAYAKGTVRVIEELEKRWSEDKRLGECYTIRIRAEVIPDELALNRAISKSRTSPIDDANAPLVVEARTDKASYREGEHIRVSIRGNRSFYARLVYRDAAGQLIQLLPNPHRKDNFFQGGVSYQIPDVSDRFKLKVGTPFGDESITLYASTSRLGDIDLSALGSVYAVVTDGAKVGKRSRNVNVGKGTSTSAQFAEASAAIKTGR